MKMNKSTEGLRYAVYKLNHAAYVARRTLDCNDNDILNRLKENYNEVTSYVNDVFEYIDKYNQELIGVINKAKNKDLDEEVIASLEQSLLQMPEKFEKTLKDSYTKIEKMSDESYKLGDDINLTPEELDNASNMMWNFFESNLIKNDK